MKAHDVKHLTADQLDAFLEGNRSDQVTSHLETCAPCRTMVRLDQRVIAALTALPVLDPAVGFDARVMARVEVKAYPAAENAYRTPREQAARRRMVLGGLLTTGAIAAGFVWAAAHPAQALDWANPALTNAESSLWFTFKTLAANTSEQPWIGAARDILASPGKAFPAFVLVAGAYAAALTGLRRLLTTEPATDAGV